jgi:hypothetical protein
MKCTIVGKVCKKTNADISEKLPLQIDLTDFCERRWDKVRAAGIYALGEYVRPTPPNRTGYQYECTTPGQVGVTEPQWPTTTTETVLDGSVVWTCRAMGNNSLLKTIADVEWDGDGFDVTDQETANTAGRQLVSAFISGEQARGKYTVIASVEFSDSHEEDFGIEVKME